MSQKNSNEKAAMMPYIEDINKIEGFDPAPFAIDYTDLKTGEVRKRLPVVIRIAMFRMKHLQGKIAVQAALSHRQGYIRTTKTVRMSSLPKPRLSGAHARINPLFHLANGRRRQP